MRRLLLSALFSLFVQISVQADPFVFLPNGELAFNTSFTTQGTFTCSLCTSGSGTNSIVFGSGADTVTITFTGVSTTVVVGGQVVPTTIGQFDVVATGSGFVFPLGQGNNQPLVTFSLGINQTSPTAGSRNINFLAFGGGTSLVFGPNLSDHITFPTGPNPPGFGFTHIVYTFPQFTIPNSDETVNLNADLVAVPEPTSLLLLGSGLGMAISIVRRRRAKS